MRSLASAAASLALLSAAGAASAVVIEPDGTQVPDDSSGLLAALFQQNVDPIDVHADASTTPSSFSPTCGFTATFVLHSAGYVLSLAWYNETGQKPPDNDLHVVIPAGAPIGQAFSGTDIKNDPAYLGGQVGFAIVGQQTHYTNPNYNPSCSVPFICDNPGPWIMALVYPSKKVANAYYIAFEDGSANSVSFSNDGDFNDDVYFITGIACSGGGEPCDTGLPGICGPGITQCTGQGPICLGVTPAAPAETCNGLDDDCDGQVDEGDICPSGYVCDKGTCVQSCQSGEFTCPLDKVCSEGGYCVDPACDGVDCPSGQVCVAGVCKGPCDGVVCPLGQVCRVGACVDPCAGVTCEGSQVCDGGVCVAPCDCQPCPADKACDGATRLCVDPSCAGVSCAAGSSCVGGVCVDACAGAVCPSGQVCMEGQCVDEPSMATTDASSGTGEIVGSGGAGGASAVATTATGNGGAPEAGAGGAFEPNDASGSSACGCRLVGEGAGDAASCAAALGAFALAARRRRRRSVGSR